MKNSEIEHLELMAIGDISLHLNISKGRAHILVKNYNIPYKNTSAGKIFLKSDIIKFQKERSENMKHAKKSLRK